jgi:hypothetical protein
MYFCFYMYICIFLFYNEGSKSFFFYHADRGTSRLTGMPTLGHPGDAQAAAEVDVEVGGIQEVERNVCGLTIDVPSMKI